MNQYALLSEVPYALTRKSDPQSSYDAAQKAAGRVARDRAIIYDVVCQAGAAGATVLDVASTGRIGFVEANRRTAEMDRAGLITRRLKQNAANNRDFIRRGKCAIWWVK